MRMYNYKGLSNCCGERIRKKRELNGWSQEYLAAKLKLAGLNYTQKMVRRVEKGLRVLPDYELRFYAEILNVSVLWLFDLE